MSDLKFIFFYVTSLLVDIPSGLKKLYSGLTNRKKKKIDIKIGIMDCEYQYVKMCFRTGPSFQNRTLQDWFDPRSRKRQQICFTKLNFKNCWVHIMLNLAVYSSDRTILSAYLNFCACIK